MTSISSKDIAIVLNHLDMLDAHSQDWSEMRGEWLMSVADCQTEEEQNEYMRRLRDAERHLQEFAQRMIDIGAKDIKM